MICAAAAGAETRLGHPLPATGRSTARWSRTSRRTSADDPQRASGVATNRMVWALTHMTQAGLLTRPRRGRWCPRTGPETWPPCLAPARTSLRGSAAGSAQGRESVRPYPAGPARRDRVLVGPLPRGAPRIRPVGKPRGSDRAGDEGRRESGSGRRYNFARSRKLAGQRRQGRAVGELRGRGCR